MVMLSPDRVAGCERMDDAAAHDDVAGQSPSATDRTPDCISRFLEEWQATGTVEPLECLIVAVRPLVETVAVRVLRSRQIADPAAVEDVVSLVLDHLRRLPGGVDGERQVAAFRAGGAAGAGAAYVRLLARNRALDVARHRRRRDRMARVFSALDAGGMQALVRQTPRGHHEPDGDTLVRLAQGIERLEPRLRSVVRLLLEGKSQAVIAHVLGVCEGTVSRARDRAVARLRELLGG